MAKPRRKQACTPELIANLRFRYEETAESVVDIARSIARSHTYLRELAREHGWVKFVPPPLDLTPAARLAAEAGKFAAEAGRLAALPPPERGRPPNDVRRVGVIGEETAMTPTRTASPPDLALAEGGEEESAEGGETASTALAGGGETDVASADLSSLAPDARLARLSASARILDFQLGLLHQKQALPQRGEDMKQINAEVRSLTATAALIEHQLRDLAHGRSTPLPDHDHDDDIPEDIDAFRLRLAAKIEEFLERRPDLGDGDEDAGAGCDPAGS